jgi:hypothetical protein
MNFPSSLPFISFLQYSPKGNGSAGQKSKTFMYAIKADGPIAAKNVKGEWIMVNAINAITNLLAREAQKQAVLNKYFGADVTLIPIPRSTPLAAKDALWPTHRICRAFVERGLGGDIAPVLERHRPVQKSSMAKPGQRPGPQEHYDSTRISQGEVVLAGRRITLVDDVVTRGSSFVGMMPHVRTAFPDLEINCFALVRTQSYDPVDQIVAPVEGVITYENGQLRRTP